MVREDAAARELRREVPGGQDAQVLPRPARPDPPSGPEPARGRRDCCV